MAAVSTPGPIPKEALAFFRNKGLKVGFDHRDVWREEHAHAFTVAKAMELDVLTSIRVELDRAIAEGRTLRQFRNDLTPTLQKLGWWGRKEVVDEAAGESVVAQLGSPRRLRTIYHANLRSARAAGQWERAQRTKKTLPYFLRTLGPSKEHRPEHVAWHGTLLLIDDPWWDTHMPPNGWECKCRVRQVSAAEAERLKGSGILAADRKQIINPETGLPTGHLEQRFAPIKTEAPHIERMPWENKRTGLVEMVPKGIDPGWDSNPGKVRQQTLEAMLAGKMVGAPRVVVDATIRDLLSSGRWSSWIDSVLADRTRRGRALIVGAIDAETEAYLATQGVELLSPVIDIDDHTIVHGGREKKGDRNASLSDDDLRLLPDALTAADLFWDSLNPALVYAFDVRTAGKKGKGIVRINFKQRGEVTNRIRTTGLVQPENMADPRYKKIPR